MGDLGKLIVAKGFKKLPNLVTLDVMLVRSLHFIVTGSVTREPVLKRFYSVNFALRQFLKHSDWLKIFRNLSKRLKKYCRVKFKL